MAGSAPFRPRFTGGDMVGRGGLGGLGGCGGAIDLDDLVRMAASRPGRGRLVPACSRWFAKPGTSRPRPCPVAFDTARSGRVAGGNCTGGLDGGGREWVRRGFCWTIRFSDIVAENC